MNTLLPKVVLHEHIEGSVTPEVALILAEKHKVILPASFLYKEGEYDAEDFPNGRYRYDESDFGEFIKAYDIVADLVRDPDDYYFITKDYLSRNAQKGMVYCELITSAHHICYTASADGGVLDARRYHDVMDAMDKAIEEVKQQYGTETRLHGCGVRHLDRLDLDNSVRFIKENPRQSVTGFNIAGNEMAGAFADFEYVHRLVDEIPLAKSYHAGEICGPESIREAIVCGAQRIGHGIACIKDSELIETLIAKEITLEVSPSSNRILVSEFEQSFRLHPLRDIYECGVRLSINTDDAGLFGTDIGKEYVIAAEVFGFSRVELLDVTLCALEAAFVSKSEKASLIKAVYASFTEDDIESLEQVCLVRKSGALYDRLKARLEWLVGLRQSDDAQS